MEFGITATKSAAAEDFWLEIGETGRRRYIRAIDDDMAYSLLEWQEIPKPVRSALGREMNTHYRGSEVGTTRGRTFDPEKTLTYQEGMEIWQLLPESKKKRLLMSLNVNLDRHPNTLWSELEQALQVKLMKILGGRTKATSKAAPDNILAVIFGLVAGSGGAMNYNTLIAKLLGFGLSTIAAKSGIAASLKTSLLAGGQTRWLTNIHKGQGITFINASIDQKGMAQRVDYDKEMTLQIGDEVAFRDYKKQDMVVGKIAAFNDDHAHIKQNNGNGSYLHVPRRELIKTDELMITSEYGMTAWNRLKESERHEILKENNLPMHNTTRVWKDIMSDVKDVLMKKYHTDVFKQLDNVKKSEVDMSGLASEYNQMFVAAGGESMDEKKKNNFDSLYSEYYKNTVKYKDQFYKVVSVNSTGLLEIVNAQSTLFVAPTQVKITKIDRVRKEKIGDFLCPNCGDTFSVKEEYMDHTQHHDTRSGLDKMEDMAKGGWNDSLLRFFEVSGTLYEIGVQFNEYTVSIQDHSFELDELVESLGGTIEIKGSLVHCYQSKSDTSKVNTQKLEKYGGNDVVESRSNVGGLRDIDGKAISDSDIIYDARSGNGLEDGGIWMGYRRFADGTEYIDVLASYGGHMMSIDIRNAKVATEDELINAGLM